MVRVASVIWNLFKERDCATGAYAPRYRRRLQSKLP